jgi:hypothetical protein
VYGGVGWGGVGCFLPSALDSGEGSPSDASSFYSRKFTIYSTMEQYGNTCAEQSSNDDSPIYVHIVCIMLCVPLFFSEQAYHLLMAQESC